MSLSWLMACMLAAGSAKAARAPKPAPVKPPAVAAPAPSGPSGVVLLPTVGLKAADGYSPKPEVVGKASAALRAAWTRSKLEPAAWVFGSETPTLEESARVLSTLRAKPIPAAVEKLLAEAEAAKAEFAYAKQAKLLLAAIDALGKSMQDARQIEALIDARIALASAYLDNNERTFAEAEFTKVVRMRPDTELDLRAFAPNVVDLFNQVKLRVLAEPTADVEVEVRPHGALVVLNGFVVGQSPKTLAVRKGDYLIQVVAPGYEPFSRLIAIAATGGVRVDGTMVRESVHRAADVLVAGLRGEGELATLGPQAERLRAAANAEGIVLSGVTDVDGGYALIVVLVGRDTRRAVATFSDSWAEAEAAALAALDQLAAAGAGGDYALVTAGEPPLAVQRLGLAFTSYLLGVPGAPVRPDVIPSMFGPMGPGFAAPTKSRCEGEDPPLYCSVWPWLVAGGAVIGAGVGSYFLLRDGDDRPRDRQIDLRVLAPAPSVGVGQP